MTRIAIGPGEVAGYFSSLKSGFDALGIECEHFLLTPSKFRYREHRYFLDTACARALKLRASRWRPVRLIGLAYALLLRIAIFIYAIAKYDTFIFNGSWSFYKFYDLPILKLLNKKVIVIFLGSDARPPIFCGRHLDDDGDLVDPAAALVETRTIHDKARRIERFADCIVNHTATDQFFTRPYVRFAAIGLPISPIDGAAPTRSGRGVKIVHAPSRPLAKGSHVFRQVIDELRGEGFEIEFVELVGVTNARVLEELSSCDFILDELYSDTPMAMFATEAAMFGKPTVVGGYYSEDYDRHNPGGPRPPSLFVRPDSIKPAVRRLIEDAEFRQALGESARDFVRHEWNAMAVASRLLQVVEDRAPSDWIVRPAQEDGYIWGWGLSEAYWHQQVRKYVEHNDIDGLLLGHNPRLVDKIRAELAA